MKFRLPSPSLVISTRRPRPRARRRQLRRGRSLTSTQQVKTLIAHSTAANAKHLNGYPSNHFLPARNEATSHGVHFLSAGQTVTLGKVGHFTFTSTCSTDSGQNQVTFDVTADTTADLDGNGPMPAGTKINIHTDTDALDTTPAQHAEPGRLRPGRQRLAARPRSRPTARRSTSSTTTASTGPPATAPRPTTASPATPACWADPPRPPGVPAGAGSDAGARWRHRACRQG